MHDGEDFRPGGVLATWRGLGAAAIVLAALSGPAPADPVVCNVAGVTVDAESLETRDTVCRIVEEALPLLASCHLRLDGSLAFIISDDLPIEAPHCLGYYTCAERTIRLRPAAGMTQTLTPESAYSKLDPGLLFESIVVHELTHALYEDIRCPSDACRSGHEYVATAMQMSWLPEAARDDIVARYPLEHPVGQALLSPLIAGLAPQRYAAVVWQHFSEGRNGCDFVGRLSRGEVSLSVPLP